MRVVKNLLKPTYGRPFFVCSDKTNPCSFWVWDDVRPITKPECRHGSPCVIRKVKKEGLKRAKKGVWRMRNRTDFGAKYWSVSWFA